MLRRSTNYLVVHCAATKPSQDIGLEEIRRWHTDPPPQGRGWANVGYHTIIRRDGTVEPGRHIAEVGAHVQGHNHESVGICLVGGVNEQGEPEANYTDAQWVALRDLLTELKKQYPTAKICGHRDFAGVLKACPSFDVRGWLAAQGMT